jgi:signal transduction histidine kinase/ActR/RegA family two-component response regulator
MFKDGAAVAVDSAQLISSMFALLPVPVAILDDRGRVILSNSSFSETFQGIANLSTEAQHEVEVPGRGTFQIHTLPLNDDGFNFAFATDISDQAQLRKQISHLEKMAAVGRVLTGVAHELGTPLADIASYAMLVDRSNLPPEVRQMVGSMLTKAERATSLVQNLLTLAGITAPKRVAVDLNAIVRDAMERRGRRQRMGQFDITLDLDPNLPKAIGDPAQIEQVVLAILLNAEDSIASVQNRPGTVQIRTCVRTGRIQLHVCDNGYARDAARIFEPNQRGVGLNICAEIVKDHGGELYAWSSYGSGSTLTLELPLLEQDSESAAGMGRCLRGKNVMVVDDEVHITEFVYDVLTRHGARVQIANSGSEAYEKMRNKHFDLVLCDQHMPGLSGQSLYRLMESSDPSISERFLFVTGDVVSSTRHFYSQNGLNYLRKPFRIQELLEAVEQVVNRNPQPGS